MANPSLQRVPCALDQTAKQVEDLVLHLQNHHETSRAEVTPLERADGSLRDGTTVASIQTADGVSKIVTESFMQLLDIPAYRTPIENALRHDRLRNALLNLLAYMVRWERPTQQAAHHITADATKDQPQRQPTAEVDNSQPRVAASGGNVVRCRYFLLAILADMLGKGAQHLTEQRSGAGSGVAQGAGRRRADTLAPDRPTRSLLALELGCALLRMHTLQCCSRQVAAVCARAGGEVHEEQQEGEGKGGQQQEHHQQRERQQQGPGHRRKQEGEQQRAGAEQEDRHNWRRNASGDLGIVRSSLGLVDGLLALAEAAVEVVSSDAEPPPAGPGAAAAAAQQADCRRLSRRFLLLLACSLRDSHLLEHCARAVVVAATGRRRCGTSGSACGDAVAAEGQGQGRAGGSADLGALRSLIHEVSWTEHGARGLLQACEHAPGPASTVVGAAVRQALTGTTMVHLALALGLRALWSADGGPEYGMPVSYRALPAEWDARKPREGEALYSAQYHLIAMVDMIDCPQLRGYLLGLLGSEGPMLTLLLRVCELATRSAAVHGGRREEELEGDEREGHGGRGGQGSSTPGRLRHVMAPDACLRIGLNGCKAAGTLLEECWEQLQLQTQARESGTGGGRSHLVVGPAHGGSGHAGGEEAGGGAGPSTQAHGPAEAGGGAPGAARAGSSGGCAGGRSKGPDATVPVEAALEDMPGPRAAAAEDAAAAAAAAATAAQAGAPMPLGQQAPGPAARRRRPLSAAALLAFEVQWWRCMCRAAEHMSLLRPRSEELVSAEEVAHGLAASVQPGQLDLPDPFEGLLPPAPPPRLSAALDGGLLPCLDGIMRRAARDSEGTTSGVVCEVLALAANSGRRWAGFLWLLAYGQVEQGLGFLRALRGLLPTQPEGGGGGGGGRRRPGLRGSAQGGDMGLLPQSAVMASCMAAGSGLKLWLQHSEPVEVDSSGSGGGSSGGAALPHAPPPPGHPRLQLLLSHAVRLLLPPLARLVRGHAGAGVEQQQQNEALRPWRLTAGVVAPVLAWVLALCHVDMQGGSGSGSGSGSGDSDGVGGSAYTPDQQQQGALQAQDCALQRFLFEELGAVELLGAVLRHLHALPSFPGREVTLARALCLLAAAFPHDVRRRCTAAECPQGGSGSSSSSAKGGAKGRRERGAPGVGAGARAGASFQVGSVWPVALVRTLGAEVDVVEVEGLAAAIEALAGLLEAWGDGRGVQEEEKGGEVSRLRAAVELLDGGGRAPRSRARVLLEVLSQPTPLDA